MQTERGFLGISVLIAIVLGLIVVSGGAYYVVQRQAPSQTTFENPQNTLFGPNRTLPTENTVSNPSVNSQAGQSIEFISPVASESLTRGSSHVVIWAGDYSGKLTLNVVSTPVGSKISSVVTDNVTSSGERNQIVWNVPCNFDNSQNWYRLLLVDKTTGAVVAESPAFIISNEQVSLCSSTAVTAVSGPTSLSVGQAGMWEISVPGATRFAVIWADGSPVSVSEGSGIPNDAEFTASPSFTHTFSKSGTYYVQFFTKSLAGKVDVQSFSISVR